MNRFKHLFSSISSFYHSFKISWQLSGLASPEVLIPASILLGLFLGTVGFLFGKTCSPLPMTLSFCIGALLAFLHSKKHGLLFIGLTGLLLLLTAYTFSYTGPDAQAYHFPMQHLIKSGWNPIFDSTIEKFNAFSDLGRCALYHTLFLPRVTALTGAFIASATGLWIADAFLGYTLVLTLFTVSYRFAKELYSPDITPGPAIIFAAFITFSTKITSFLAGQIDYTVYAAFIIAIMSILHYHRTNTPRECVLFFLSLLLTMLSKSTGLVYGALTFFISYLFLWKRPAFRRGSVIFLLFAFILGLTPYLTSWIQYGHPLYPTMTYAPNITPVDITSDFTGNSDALSMGYLSRIIYAWISKTLAIKSCAWYFDNPAFNPVFTVEGGVEGLGLIFRLLIGCSFIALLFSKKSTLFYLCLFIFITSNLAPLKYIGFNRYFPQIWALPALALYNFIYHPNRRLPLFLHNWSKPFIFTLFIAFAGLSLLRSFTYQGCMLAFEKARQDEFEKICATGETYALTDPLNSYTFRKRMEIAGIQFKQDPSLPQLSFDDHFAIASCEDASAIVKHLTEKYPFCNTIGQVLTFPYYSAFTSFPSPNLEVKTENPSR